MTMFAMAKTKAEGSPLSHAHLLKSHDKVSGQYLRFNGNHFISKICLQRSLGIMALSCPQFKKETGKDGESVHLPEPVTGLCQTSGLYCQLSSGLQDSKGVAGKYADFSTSVSITPHEIPFVSSGFLGQGRIPNPRK